MKDYFEFNEPERPVSELGEEDCLERFTDELLFAEPDSYFELISAYLDGEVTGPERRQVQLWLDTDPKARKLYNSLSRLHHAVNRIPVSPSTPDTIALSEKVFQSIDKQRRGNRLLFIGGAAIAALILGAVSTLFSNQPAAFHEVAQIPSHSNAIESESEPLMIALNRPVVALPPSLEH
jgi:anti-sigma factor RsiW